MQIDMFNCIDSYSSIAVYIARLQLKVTIGVRIDLVELSIVTAVTVIVVVAFLHILHFVPAAPLGRFIVGLSIHPP